VQGVVTYKAVLAIDNTELLIRPGMTATAEILVEEVADALLVPNPALRFSPAALEARQQSRGLIEMLLPRPPASFLRPASKPEVGGRNRTVWVLDGGVASEVPVVIGSTDGRHTRIVEGKIAPGQEVIVDAVASGG
jgi:HlyD family secretion protein